MFLVCATLMVVAMLKSKAVFPFCCMPFFPIPFFLLNSLFTQYVSNRMLRFFLELFEKERLA